MVVGINCTAAVFRTANMHMASLAELQFLFTFCNSFIARIPRGVAAFPSPRKFAVKFITIDVIAGLFLGTSGNNIFNNGVAARAIILTNPIFQLCASARTKDT